MAALLIGGALAATAVVVDDGSIAATAVSVDDGSTTGGAVIGNNGAAFGPMHVMHCMCAGWPYGPYLDSHQFARHGLWKHMWTLRGFASGPYNELLDLFTFAQMYNPFSFLCF